MMIYHYPRWLLLTSLSLLIAACYAWVGSHQWPLAAYAVGSTILVAFLLQSNAFLTDETRRLDTNQAALIKGLKYIRVHLGIVDPDEPVPDPAMVRPTVFRPGEGHPPVAPTIPLPVPVKLDVEDRRERALNTESNLLNSKSVDRATESVDRLRESIEKTIPPAQ